MDKRVFRDLDDRMFKKDMRKYLEVKVYHNKSNGQCTISLPKKKIEDMNLGKIDKIKFLLYGRHK